MVAAVLGIYDFDRIAQAPWVGLPSEWPGLALEFGIPFWTLLPSFLFLGVIISIQSNGEAIGLQRASWRQDRAVDFRQVQGALAGAGVTNLLAGLGGAVPNIISPGIVAFTRITGVASLRMGYCIGCIFILVAFLPKVSGLLSSIPGPVLTGYLVMVTGTLFVDGARTVIQTEQNSQRVVVAGVCFWIGASFQFGLFNLPSLNPVLATLLKSAVTTGGFAAIAMILYLELTSPKRMRFTSRLDIEALADLYEFIARFAASRGWNTAMKDRLSAVAEETLLTLSPMDLEGTRPSGTSGAWWSWRPATARLQTWSSSAEETRRILRTRSGSSSSTTRRLLRSRTSRSGCCEATPLRCGISSTTIPTSSRSASAHPGRDR